MGRPIEQAAHSTETGASHDDSVHQLMGIGLWNNEDVINSMTHSVRLSRPNAMHFGLASPANLEAFVKQKRKSDLNRLGFKSQSIMVIALIKLIG